MTTSSSHVPAGDDELLCEAEAFVRQQRAIFYAKTDTPCPDDVLRSLKAPRHAGVIAIDELAHVCAEVLGKRPAFIESLAQQGTYHALYRVSVAGQCSLILRLNVLSDRQRDFQLYVEQAVSDLARAAAIPAPRVVHLDTSRRRCPFDFALLEEAEGQSLRTLDHDDALILPWLAELGRVTATLHSIERPGFGWIDVRPLLARGPARLEGIFSDWADYVLLNLDAHLRTCVAINAVTLDETRRIEALFERHRDLLVGVPAALLHGDLGNHNIFIDGQRISAVLDWEDCLLGDPVFDIAFWATFHPRRRHQVFLDAYQDIRPLPADFEPRFWLYFLRVALSKTVHRWRFGTPDHPDRPPASRRIQLALESLEPM
ncbi:MAG: phosphotransferase [Phycisphaerae bacterium]|nr:phosphotransferase [Phycisphaerae bacterium]